MKKKAKFYFLLSYSDYLSFIFIYFLIKKYKDANKMKCDFNRLIRK